MVKIVIFFRFDYDEIKSCFSKIVNDYLTIFNFLHCVILTFKYQYLMGKLKKQSNLTSNIVKNEENLNSNEIQPQNAKDQGTSFEQSHDIMPKSPSRDKNQSKKKSKSNQKVSNNKKAKLQESQEEFDHQDINQKPSNFQIQKRPKRKSTKKSVTIQEEESFQQTKNAPEANQQLNESKFKLSQNANQKMNSFLSKFTDDDSITEINVDHSSEENMNKNSSLNQTNKRKSKDNKNTVKIKNKLFSNLIHEEDESISVKQKCEYAGEELILVKRNTHTSTAIPLLSKLNDKVDRFKNKLDLKVSDNGQNYKKKIQENIKDVEEVQNLQLIIQLPKVGHSSHVDAALYLKNVKSSQENTSHIQKTNFTKEKVQKNINRNEFYSRFTHEIKCSKIETISDNEIQNCFKKSSLDQEDFIDMNDNVSMHSNISFSRKEHVSITQRSSNNRHSNQQKIQKSNEIQHQEQNKLKIQESVIQKQNQIAIPEKKQQTDTEEEKENNQNTNSFARMNESQKMKIADKLVRIAKRIDQRKKLKISKPAHKLKTFDVKYYIEEQAQLSDEENCPTELDEQQYEGVNLDEDLVDLIDNTVQFKQGDQKIAYRKFVEDMRLQDQRLIQRIKNGIYGNKLKYQDTESEKNRKKRMLEVARKNKEKDNYSKAIETKQVNTSQEQQSEPNSEENKMKLKSLEENLYGNCYKKTNSFDENSKSYHQHNQPTYGNISLFLPQNKDVRKSEKTGLKTMAVPDNKRITFFKNDPKKTQKNKSNGAKADLFISHA